MSYIRKRELQSLEHNSRRADSFCMTVKKQGTDTHVTASIVTFNNADEIQTVLSSLEEQLDSPNIYVVDNASADGSPDIVKAGFPSVNLLVNESNLGFGAAHNMAIRQVCSKYHIIINPDVTVCDGCVETLAAFFDEHPDVVCASPRILNPDGTEQHLPKYYPTLKYILSSTLEKRFGFAKRWRDEYTMRNEVLNDVTDIQTCSGCFMFIRTDILKQLGGFDERYFLHFDDIDLSRRLGEHGRIVFVPTASIVHQWRRGNHSDRKVRWIAKKSMVKFFFKWAFHNGRKRI